MNKEIEKLEAKIIQAENQKRGYENSRKQLGKVVENRIIEADIKIKTLKKQLEDIIKNNKN